MSICSDVFISREEALTMIKKQLMYEQERIVDLAIKNMPNWEITSYINSDGSIYYYNIKEDGVLDENNR